MDAKKAGELIAELAEVVREMPDDEVAAELRALREQVEKLSAAKESCQGCHGHCSGHCHLHCNWGHCWCSIWHVNQIIYPNTLTSGSTNVISVPLSASSTYQVVRYT